MGEATVSGYMWKSCPGLTQQQSVLHSPTLPSLPTPPAIQPIYPDFKFEAFQVTPLAGEDAHGYHQRVSSWILRDQQSKLFRGYLLPVQPLMGVEPKLPPGAQLWPSALQPAPADSTALQITRNMILQQWEQTRINGIFRGTFWHGPVAPGQSTVTCQSTEVQRPPVTGTKRASALDLLPSQNRRRLESEWTHITSETTEVLFSPEPMDENPFPGSQRQSDEDWNKWTSWYSHSTDEGTTQRQGFQGQQDAAKPRYTDEEWATWRSQQQPDESSNTPITPTILAIATEFKVPPKREHIRKELCGYWQGKRGKGCKNALNCPYAHGASQLTNRTCWRYLKGQCTWGEHCADAHPPHETTRTGGTNTSSSSSTTPR